MQAADSEANIIFGANIDEELKDEVRITVIATGFEKTPFPTRDPKGKRPGARSATGPYGMASAAMNPYENRTPSEPVSEDAPAPLNTYDADSFAPGMRPMAAQRPVTSVPYAPSPYAAPTYAMPQQPAQQPYVPYQTPAAPAPVQEQPAASEKDDLGVPAYLRRKK